MASVEEAGNVLLSQLKWVHSLVRGELQACRELAAKVADGASTDEVRAQVEALQTRGPLFQLRVNCLYYCRFVHSHHGHEDASLFPAVRRFAPELATVVDKLEADHRRVSDLLDGVETAAKQLGGPEDASVRALLVAALDELSRHLLEHLAYEEEVLAPVLGAWDYWPF
jgi:iron-sulfur cluster repair protein YtfE (RIC family)